MLAVNLDQTPQDAEQLNQVIAFPIAVEVQIDPEVTELLVDLSPDTPWAERRMAARKLGYLRNPQAVPAMLAALPTDPFWMVRCAIIQALEMIGDPGAIPTLQAVAASDGFQVVRSHAEKAVERLS
jgi:HEAT repeat protein